MVALTPRGWAFVAAAVLAIVIAYSAGLRELLYVGALLALLPAASLAFVASGRQRLSVRRVLQPSLLEAGRPASVTITVRNSSRFRSRRARWTDSLPWQQAESPGGELRALRPGRVDAEVLKYDLTPPQRGVFSLGSLGVEISDGFGLARSSRAVGGVSPVVVTPALVELRETGLRASVGEGESTLVQRRSSGDDDDTITREYRSGDAMRRVHWRASARHGDLMVRQEEQRSLPEARIIVETRRRGYADMTGVDASDGSNCFEWAVRMLASVTVHLRRSGFHVHIDETGPTQLAALGRRRAWVDEEFLVGLAGLVLTDRAGSFPSRAGVGPVIAIIGSPDPVTADWLVAQRRRGELAIAFIVRSVSAVDVLERSFGVSSGGAATALEERLSDAGWLVVPVRDDDDPADAWEAVVVEAGRSRVGS